MYIQPSAIETNCGQWLNKPHPNGVDQSLEKWRPMPPEFWMVDHHTMEMPEMRAYNPSILRYRGGMVMSYRRHGLSDATAAVNGGESHMVICDLDETFKKTSNHRVIKGLIGRNTEDGRLFMHRGQAYMSYTSATYRENTFWDCEMKCARLDDNFNAESHGDVGFGVNGALHEKNWTYFSINGMLRFVYNIEPFVVFEVETRKVWSHRHLGEWTFGIPHGGTPPIEYNGLYVSFFHSYRHDPVHKRRYFVGAYAFDKEMKVRMFTPWPIMAGDARDGYIFDATGSDWHPQVALPCGAILEDGQWVVSLGINDSYCGMMRINADHLFKSVLHPVRSS